MMKKSAKRKLDDTSFEQESEDKISSDIAVGIKVPKKEKIQIKRRAPKEIIQNPIRVLTEFLGHERPFTAEELTRFEIWLQEEMNYRHVTIAEVKKSIFNFYENEKIGAFSQKFPELCDSWMTRLTHSRKCRK